MGINIETSFTVANKTNKQAELFVVEQDLVDDNPTKVKVSFKSHTIQAEPYSISSTQLEINADKVLVGIVNTYDDVISNELGMTKQVDLTKQSNVKIKVTTKNTIELL